MGNGCKVEVTVVEWRLKPPLTKALLAVHVVMLII